MQSDIEKLMEPVQKNIQSSIMNWFGSKTTDMSDRINNISSALQVMADELENKEESELAGFVRSGAESMGEVFSKAEGVDPEEILSMIENQSSEHPAGVFFASAAAGFLSTRVAKQAVQQQSDEAEAESLPEYSEGQQNPDMYFQEATVDTFEVGDGSTTQPFPNYGQDPERPIKGTPQP